MTIERFDFESRDIAKSNVEIIGELFPGVITEKMDKNGVLKRAIDFDKLMAELRDDVVGKGKERYEFTWPGKRQAMAEANKSINKTLRPVVEESKDWDNTENLYIEGDNLEVLKLLQESYLSKVKMIYIDPPYNTGKDFVYNDFYEIDSEKYKDMSDEYNEENEKLLPNPQSNGRFHSDWCSMIYPRLKLARNLLSDDGVIFISIDDNEQENLKKICNEVFGENNYIQEIIWQKKFSPQNDAKYFSLNHESILCYAKNKKDFKRNLLPATEEMKSRYKNLDNDPRGPWSSGDCTIGRVTERDYYPIITPSGRVVYPSNGNVWRYSKETFKKLITDNRIWFGKDGNNMPRVKRFLSETNPGVVPISIWFIDDVGHTQSAFQSLKSMFDDKDIFDYPKPVGLLKRCIHIGTEKDSIILDFFSGFRVIIVIEANSYVNIRSSRFLPNFKTQKINSWCAA